MSKVTVEKNRCTVDPLYQWDLNQILVIHGLSLPTTPEIHFTNATMDRAIVRQATMNDAGVIIADIPNSLLQKPFKITAYVCIYEGEEFKTRYSITIPVFARPKPGDYTISDNDGEIYSFRALEHKIDNILATLVAENERLYDEAVENLIAEIENNGSSGGMERVGSVTVTPSVGQECFYLGDDRSYNKTGGYFLGSYALDSIARCDFIIVNLTMASDSYETFNLILSGGQGYRSYAENSMVSGGSEGVYIPSMLADLIFGEPSWSEEGWLQCEVLCSSVTFTGYNLPRA